jgi:imidazolonepropionase-like amidohydrolase
LARPKRYLRHLPRQITPDQLPDAIIDEAIASDGWVKLVGDWIDRSMAEPDLALLWPDDKLAEAVNRVHELGVRVTTHVFSAEGAAQALRCGIDCIEHGTGMDAKMMAEAAAKGVAVVPTMIQREHFAEIAESGQGRFPVWERHIMSMYEERYAQAKQLYDAGIQLLVGSDESANIPHGIYCTETDLMALAGIDPEAVVAAASYGTRRYLAIPGIEPGASADLVVYAADPRQDVTVLHQPQAIILRGSLVAGTVAAAVL